MALKVGQLYATLTLDKASYSRALAQAKQEAAAAGKAASDAFRGISDGFKAAAGRIPGIMSDAASAAIAQMDRLGAEGQRAATLLQAPPQQLTALAQQAGISVDALRGELSHAAKSARDLGLAVEESGRRGGVSLRDLAATARSILPALGVGAVLSKGFERLTSIDSAKAKLAGLGHDAAEVSQIMNDALGAVKGTAFGLDEAASVAATAVAANIQPGQQLESTLKLIADTAAVAGSSLGEMGSIFNKVAANGRLNTLVMQQLQDHGIPVLVKLAEHYGITNEAAQTMVTDGKVSFAEFSAVMQETLGGSALKMGDTIKGTLDNTSAALSRLGAGVLQNFVPALTAAADSVIWLADGWGKLPAPVRDATLAVGAFVALQKAGVFTKLAQGGSALVDTLRAIKAEGLAASGALEKVGKVGAVAFAALAVGSLVSAWQEYHATLVDVNQIIDTNTGLLKENSDELLKQSLAPYIDSLNAAGLTMDQVVTAMKAGGPALDEVNQKLIDSQSVVRGIAADLGHTFTIGMWTSERDKALRKIEETSDQLLGQQAALAEQNRLAAQSSDAAAEATGRMIGPTIAEANAAAQAAAEQQKRQASLTGLSAVTGSARTAMLQWIAAQDKAASAARDVAAAVDETTAAYNRSIIGLAGSAQSAAEAMRDAQLAADKTGRSIVDTAGNFDLSQGSVRDAVSGLYSYVDATNDSISALYKHTAAQDGTVAAQQAAQAAALDARQGFIDMATSIWGVSIPAAEAIANQLGFLQGIKIDDKTFTVTMVRRTVDVDVANSALGDSWMRRINQDAAAAASQAAGGFKMPSLSDLMGGVSPSSTPKAGGGGGGGKSADDAKRA